MSAKRVKLSKIPTKTGLIWENDHIKNGKSDQFFVIYNTFLTWKMFLLLSGLG